MEAALATLVTATSLADPGALAIPAGIRTSTATNWKKNVRIRFNQSKIKTGRSPQVTVSGRWAGSWAA